MTKKRFKIGLAALGILTSFFIGLTALLFAPTLASADKDSGTGHQHTDRSSDGSPGNSGNTPDPVYFGHPDGNQNQNVAWNNPGDASGPCTGTSCSDQNDDSQYFGGPTGPSGDGGSSGGDPNDWNGNGFGGGFSGGSFGGGFGFSGGGSGGSSGNGNTNPHGHSGPDNSGPGNSGSDDDSGPGDPPPGGDPQFFAPYNNPGNNPDNDPPPPPDFNGPPFTDPPNHDGPTGNDPPPNFPNTQKVPEPLTLSLFAVGLAGTGAIRRRSKKK